MEGKILSNKKDIVRIAGAYIAWIIGSGFSTGQEILRFFTSFGYWSYGVILLNLVGFILFGKAILETGYQHRGEADFNLFDYYCGKRIGWVYSKLVFITLLFLIPVLLSGAGATLEEYFGLERKMGSGLMALCILTSYLVGFERLLRVVSKTGPIIIFFVLFVSLSSLIMDLGQVRSLPQFSPLLYDNQSCPSWVLSGLLYLSLSFLCGADYYGALGKTANSLRTGFFGSLLGSLALMGAIFFVNTAILFQADQIAQLNIPILFLAKRISYLLGGVFSLVLVLGIFSSASAMMWMVCNRFKSLGTRGNKLTALLVALLTYIISLLPFRSLVAFLYPLIGYLGLYFIFRIFYVSIIKKNISPSKE